MLVLQLREGGGSLTPQSLSRKSAISCQSHKEEKAVFLNTERRPSGALEGGPPLRPQKSVGRGTRRSHRGKTPPRGSPLLHQRPQQPLHSSRVVLERPTDDLTTWHSLPRPWSPSPRRFRRGKKLPSLPSSSSWLKRQPQSRPRQSAFLPTYK